DLRPGAIEVSQGERSARDIVLRIQPRDPHKAARLYAGPPRDALIRKPCVIARYQDGGDAGLVLVGVHVLIAGASGSGKSNVVNEVIWWLAACPDAALWGCDLKFGLELGPWEPVFDPGHLARTPEQAVAVLEAAVRVIEWRGPEMERRGLRTWPTSPTEPALVVVIDEIQKLSANRRAVEAIKTITAQGRAVAVSVTIATQYPTNDALGGRLIAANMTAAVCLRVNKPAETNVALGPGAVSAGWKPHEISRSKPGSLYLRAAGAEEPRLARSDQVTEQMVERAAPALGTHRTRLDQGSAHAALGTPSSTPERTVQSTGPSTAVWHGDDTPPGARVGTPQRVPVDTPDDSGVGTDIWLLKGTALGAPAGPLSDQSPTGERDPMGALLEALEAAGERGARAEDLAAHIRMSRAWIFTRLGELERGGQVVRSVTGRWKLVRGGGLQNAR
ncbi:MAG TPA: FtsK/SpoIIIE domain-containing protein, partial [Streptosporangiaceae bacterium]